MSKTATRTSSSEEELSTYRPKTTGKAVIVTRTSNVRGGPRLSGIGTVQQSRMSSSFNPGVFSKMSATGISEFRGSREKEKREMQDCNERLATYIEKVRWLEAHIKKLEAELEAYRNRKQEDWKSIKNMYQEELDQATKVIAEQSVQRGHSDAKLANLQDECQSQKEIIATLQNHQKDYLKKIDQLNSQVGDIEGELATLRLRCGSLEDECGKLRALVEKYKSENSRLRADLENETAAHIEQEVLAQTKSEEVEFLNELLDKLRLLEQEPIKVKGMDAEAFFKGEIRKAIQELQLGYESELDRITAENETKLQFQMDQLRSGNVRDTMESEHAKSECKRLRDLCSERAARIAELEALLASIKAERDNYAIQLSELQMEAERERIEKERIIAELQASLEAMLVQIKELMDHKMSLELEIACYRKMLEGEEARTSGLRSLVEQTIGTQGRGGANLSDIIAGQSSMSSTTARTTVQRSSKGAIGFQSADPTGSSVTLENTSSGARAKSVDMNGWTLTKDVNGKVLSEVEIKRELAPGKTLVFIAKGSKSAPTAENEIICDFFSWGTGNGNYRLLDEKGQEKANLTMKQQL